MLGKIGIWRHLVAAGAVAGTALLAALGVIGGVPQHFDSKVVTVQPVGDDGVRIREVVDEDFGTTHQHGYERIIPTDFGEPTDVQASSPDADATVHVEPVDSGDRIRVGDPSSTITGQHRYVLTYTLPNARLASGQLALDIIGDQFKPEEQKTDRFEVVVTGLDLTSPTCNVGAFGASGGCTLARVGDVYRTVISPLAAKQGITIGGTIVGRLPIVDTPDPPLPARRADHRLQLALATLALGAATVIAVYVSARRRGRNEVFAGGAADAAYGSLPTPGGDRSDSPVRMVADSKMEDLATIEFVPPKGIEPWQGAVLLSEKFDRTTVAAWVSGLVAKDAITLTKDGHDLTIHRGPKFDRVDADTQALLEQMLDYQDELELGSYNANFSRAWNSVALLERDAIADSGWWKRLPPGSTGQGGTASGWIILVVVGFFVFGAGSVLSALLGVFNGIALALVFAVVVPFIFAHFLYRVLLPARSATGSALALRAESFRRFLDASEGKHVDWAWKQGLLREYSAWAVALGAADAWGRALADSNVPAPELNAASPIWLYTMGSSFATAQTPPSSSGSGGGSFGGFSGGSVGGGGGGGSSGSW
ncbi:MAG TPA: hypothetical protein VGC84_03925 [Ilumatobacteraceae bacterium]